VDGTGSESFSVVGCGISGVESEGFSAKVLVLFVIFTVVGNSNYSFLVSSQHTFVIVITTLITDTANYPIFFQL
jgi:hypothetical protein